MKKFLKILGVTVLSFAIIFASCFIPMKLKQSETSLNKVSASRIPPSSTDSDITTSESTLFLGSDLFLLDLNSMTTNDTVTDFSSYINNGQYITATSSYRFQFGFSSTPFSNQYQFALVYKAQASYSSYRYVSSYSSSSASDISHYNELMYAPIPNFSISDLSSSFVPNENYVSHHVTLMQNCRSGGSVVGYLNFGFSIYRDNTSTNSFVEPTFDMQYICLLNYTEVEPILGVPYASRFVGSNIICYVDSAGYYYLIYINTGNYNDINGQSYFFKYRRYSLIDIASLTDNDFYNQGLSDGFQSGYDSGALDGYQNGFSVGDNEGFSRGYNEGLNTANSYTFYNLIGAVFDAPLNTFTSLFNFEILGVNILNFLSSILTLCIVIWLIKLALGGK